MLPDGSYFEAGVFIRAVATGLIAFAYSTLANLAQGAAEQSLGPVHPAAFAVDMLRHDGRIVQLGPQFRGLLSQRLVIVLSGDKGVALLAVQAADSNQFLHIRQIIASASAGGSTFSSGQCTLPL